MGITNKLWYPCHMLVLVLTGGLGAGKSTAAAHFRKKGATVIDLDDVADQVLSRGSDVLARVADEFGDVLLADGSLDRPALAREAFVTPERTARLNALVHPAVAREVGPALQELRLMPDQPCLVVLEVPLLAEAPVFREVADVVLAVVAPESMRLRRAVSAGMVEADARRRIRAQATDAQRAALADVVIVNDSTAEEFISALDRFWDERLAGPGGCPPT